MKKRDDPRKSPYSLESIVLIAFALIAIAVFFATPSQIQAPKISFGRSVGQIEPSLFPRLASVGLLATALLALYQGRKETQVNPFAGFELGTGIQLSILVLLLWTFAFAFEPLGFVISGVSVSLLLSLFLGNRSLLGLAVVCFAVPALIYFVFTRLLLISLPEGILY